VRRLEAAANFLLLGATHRRMRISSKLFWVALPLVVGLITPSAVILCLEVFVGHISVVAAFHDVATRQFAEGHNLFLLAVFGLVPFVILSIFSFIIARSLSITRLASVTLAGLLGILAFMIPAHISVWYPLYGGGHMASTAVIAFLFIPFYCIVTLAIGLIIGWAISFIPFLRRDAKK
jgi:hypothetical protein